MINGMEIEFWNFHQKIKINLLKNSRPGNSKIFHKNAYLINIRFIYLTIKFIAKHSIMKIVIVIYYYISDRYGVNSIIIDIPNLIYILFALLAIYKIYVYICEIFKE